VPNKSNSYYLAAKTDFIDKIMLDFIDFLWMAFCTGKMSSISRRGKMVDTSRDGLLLGGGICHVTATSQLIYGGKQVTACIYNIV